MFSAGGPHLPDVGKLGLKPSSRAAK